MIKKLFGASWKGILTRVVLGLVVCEVIGTIFRAPAIIPDGSSFAGWPLQYRELYAGIWCHQGSGPCSELTSYPNFIIDFLLFYLVICALFFIFNRLLSLM